MTERTGSLRLIRWGLWSAVLISAVALFLLVTRGPAPQISKLPGAVAIGGEFTLTSHTGETFESKSLDGNPFLVFFGFTHCPDICPTTLLEVTNEIKALGDAGRDLKALFITIDPERDTPQNLAKYLESFDPSIIGLTGSSDDIQKVAGLYRAVYQKVPAEDGADTSDYSMNHTATVFMMDRSGGFAGTLSFQEKPEVRLKKLKRLLERS